MALVPPSNGDLQVSPSRPVLLPAADALLDSFGAQSRLAVAGRYEIICHRSAPRRYPEESFSELRVCVPLENALYNVRRVAESGRRKIGYLGSRDILVVPGGQPHIIDWQRQADWVSLNFSERFLRESLELHVTSISDAFTLRDPLVSSVAAELRNVMFSQQPTSPAYAEALTTAIAFRVGVASQTRFRRPGSVRPFTGARLLSIETFIDENLDKRISVTKLASREGLSRWHFVRRFSATYGVSPREFIASRRLKHAEELLLHTKLSVTEVALEIGMTPSTFSRSFLRRFGISPRRLREQNTK